MTLGEPKGSINIGINIYHGGFLLIFPIGFKGVLHDISTSLWFSYNVFPKDLLTFFLIGFWGSIHILWLLLLIFPLGFEEYYLVYTYIYLGFFPQGFPRIWIALLWFFPQGFPKLWRDSWWTYRWCLRRLIDQEGVLGLIRLVIN